MYEWVRLMTGQTLSKAEIEALVLRQAGHTVPPAQQMEKFSHKILAN
jgi:hypothetical protein